LDKIGILSIAGIFLVNFPWVRLGAVFKKIGPVEFQEILSRQSNEQIQLYTASNVIAQKPPCLA